MVETTLPNGLETSGQKGRIANFAIFQDILSISVLDDFFRNSKKGFWVFLVHLETMLPDGLETSG